MAILMLRNSLVGIINRVLILNFNANWPKMHTGGPVLFHPWGQCHQQTWRSHSHMLLLIQASLSPQLGHLWSKAGESRQSCLPPCRDYRHSYWFGDFNTVHAYLAIWGYPINSTMIYMTCTTTSQKMFLLLCLWSLKPVQHSITVIWEMI